MSRRFLVVVAFLAAAPVFAQERTHDVTINDYFTLASVNEVALSPDGSHVAYAEARWQQSTNDRRADLWVVATDGGKPKRLTMDRMAARQLRWSDDNQTVYFLGNYRHEGERAPPNDGSTQVWRIDVRRGPPTAVTRLPGGVSSFDFAGTSLFYTTSKTVSDADDFSSLRAAHRLNYGHGSRRVSELWRLNLDNWRSERLLDAARYIREFAVTRDGKKIGLITTPDDTVITFEGRSTIDVFDVNSRKFSTLPDKVWRGDMPSPFAWLESLAWSPDGNRLAFVAIFDAFPAEIIVTHWQEGRPISAKMGRPADWSIRGYGTPLAWRTSSALCYLGENHGRVRILEHSTTADKWPSTWRDADVAQAFSFSADGTRCAAVIGNDQVFAELFVLSEKAKPTRLTRLNPQTAAWKLPKIQHIVWKSPDSTEVGGILELPPNYKQGEKVPLLVGIHGGPTTAVHSNLEFNMYEGRLLFPGKGYAVLCPNYRGSTGYGDKFLTDLVGRENELDVADILAGIDHLVQQGIADPDRLGVLGWSNGGFLTNCLITKTNRFKAASSGASILDTVIEWGTNDEPAYPWVFKKGHPWEVPENYRKTSPSYDLGKVRTPTIIHVGANDERCPPGHSRMLYRALREYVKVPCELLVYPGEPHGLGRYAHRKAKMEWDAAWFDKYVKGKSKSSR